MGRSALTNAITDLLRDLPEELSHLPAVLKEIGYRIVLPTGLVLFVVLVGGQWLYEIYKIVFPPLPEDYHKKALGILKKSDDKMNRSNARKLLLRSIKLYPNYLPSYLALAAMQLYQEESIEEGVATIEAALKIFPDDKELLQMKMDAKAMEANLGHMILCGASASRYLGDAGWRTRRK